MDKNILKPQSSSHRPGHHWLARQLAGGSEELLVLTLTELDRLTSQTGILRASLDADDPLQPLLHQLYQELFDLGATMSRPSLHLSRHAGSSSSSTSDLLAQLAAILPDKDEQERPAANRNAALARNASKLCGRIERLLQELVRLDQRYSLSLARWPQLSALYPRLACALGQRSTHRADYR